MYSVNELGVIDVRTVWDKDDIYYLMNIRSRPVIWERQYVRRPRYTQEGNSHKKYLTCLRHTNLNRESLVPCQHCCSVKGEMV